MVDISKIIVGIVLYNPDIERLRNNIDAGLKQVDKVLLIDNCSKNIEEVLSIYGNNNRIIIIQNRENKGIAYALNQIMQYAIKNMFDFFVTLDQDSVVKDNYFSAMLSRLQRNSNWAIACPQVKDINLPLKNNEHGVVNISNAKETISSGCLIKTAIAKKIGGFDNRLFIDYVDVDFNERILLAGYKIIKINDAILYHELGQSEFHNLFGFKILVDNHSEIRRYYITRNRLYYSKKYFGKKGYYKEMVKVLFSGVKILLFEKDKRKKIQSIKQGTKDVKNI